ncbi:type VII secretion protein EccE [Mycobacterium kyorinense]|nr:type VII secretion protein EccE [Mycobacterium kyorinense]
MLLAAVVGWSFGGYLGGAAGLATGIVAAVIPWRRRPLWSWLALWLRRGRPVAWTEPVTVVNDGAGGGVRYQGGAAVAAVQLLGTAHTPTVFTGSASTHTANILDITALEPLMRQSLGLTIDSLSVVSWGSRRRSAGDYPRVYDTLIGAVPYAGRRETWVIVRVSGTDNAEVLQWRASIGTATLAAAQRIGSALRQRGIRARVATATDILELERRLGRSALDAGAQRWNSVRSDTGSMTTYGYLPRDITTDKLAQGWTVRADAIIQNVTLFNDGTAAAAITICSTQPPAAPPSVLLQTLPGEQLHSVAANLCGPMPAIGGMRRGVLAGELAVPIGPSGVLLGKDAAGNRFALPLDDPGEFSRVHIGADDEVAKRIVVRMAAAGERITVHTRNAQRWASIRTPDIAVTDQPRPATGTTVSVVDGTIAPAPRPNTLVFVGEPGEPCRGSADVLIMQTGPAMLEVHAAGQVHTVAVELFRAENRYVYCEHAMLGAAGLVG